MTELVATKCRWLLPVDRLIGDQLQRRLLVPNL